MVRAMGVEMINEFARAVFCVGVIFFVCTLLIKVFYACDDILKIRLLLERKEQGESNE